MNNGKSYYTNWDDPTLKRDEEYWKKKLAKIQKRIEDKYQGVSSDQMNEKFKASYDKDQYSKSKIESRLEGKPLSSDKLKYEDAKRFQENIAQGREEAGTLESIYSRVDEKTSQELARRGEKSWGDKVQRAQARTRGATIQGRDEYHLKTAVSRQDHLDAKGDAQSQREKIEINNRTDDQIGRMDQFVKNHPPGTTFNMGDLSGSATEGAIQYAKDIGLKTEVTKTAKDAFTEKMTKDAMKKAATKKLIETQGALGLKGKSAAETLKYYFVPEAYQKTQELGARKLAEEAAKKAAEAVGTEAAKTVGQEAAKEAAKDAAGSTAGGAVSIAGGAYTGYGMLKGIKTGEGATGDTATDIGMGAGKGAMAGASVGSAVPGIGTAVGAAVGAVIGGISGGLAAKQKRKDLNREEDRKHYKRLENIGEKQMVANAKSYKRMKDDFEKAMGMQRRSL